jgi:hypothetical protein
MGIDVKLYAEGEVGDEELDDATAFMTARCSIVDTFDGKYLALSLDDSYDPPRIELCTMQHYYGPGYERGDWPSIYGAVRLLQAALPACRVFYCGDVSDDGQECDEEFLAGMWAHFVGPHGDDYRREVKAWNEATQ